ncbi:MAG TPA: TolC family protein [bacterium]|nr:TolC family protein [bacterium]
MLSAFAVPVLVAAAATSAAEPGAHLSLHDAVGMALQHAFSARIAEYKETSADAKVAEARVAFLPDLSADYSENRYDDSLRGIARAAGVSSSGRETEADLNAQYTLISSTRRLNLKAAQLARESQQGQTESAKRQVIRDTARAYLQVVQADALLHLAEQDVARRQRHREEAEALVKAGKRAEYEVIRADADLAAAEAQRVDAKNAARTARSTLAQTVGAALPLDFVAESPAPPVDPRTEKKSQVAPELIRDSLNRRADVKAAEDDAESARVGVERQRRAYLPTVSLFARYTKYPNPGPTDFVDSQFMYGGQITIRFSDMLTNAWRERDARAQARLQAVVADQTRVAVSLDVERAMLEVDRAVEVKASVEKSLAAAQRNYETAAERYRLGVASQTEQIDAEVTLVSAEADAAKADVGLRTALWNLRYEMGESLDVL